MNDKLPMPIRTDTFLDTDKIADLVVKRLDTQLTGLSDENKAILRRQDSLEKDIRRIDIDLRTLDELITKVNNLFSKLFSLEDLVKRHTIKQQEAVKNITNEVSEAKTAAQDQGGEFTRAMEEKVDSKFDEMIEVVNKRDILFRSSFWGRIRSVFKGRKAK